MNEYGAACLLSSSIELETNRLVGTELVVLPEERESCIIIRVRSQTGSSTSVRL